MSTTAAEDATDDRSDDPGRALQTARAAALARAGHRTEALRLLEEQGPDHSAAELDLMARIQAQRGRLDAADDLWARAAAASGDAGAHEAQRARIAALRRRGARSTRRRRVLGLVVLLLVLVALLAALVVWRLVRDDGQAARIADLQDQQATVSRELDAARAAGVPPARPTLPSDLRARLAAEGLDVRPRPDGSLLVTFPEAPFAVEGSEPTPQARASLEELGRTVGPLGVGLRVVGHATRAADAQPADPGGANTALARALAARQVIADAGGIPADRIEYESKGATDPPFPTAPEDVNARNRTVTVTITPVG